MGLTYYPRPRILAEPGFDQGHAIIEASAGTGKTFTLEHLVLDLIIRNKANIEQILVVTFTDAATRELRERVRSLIRRVCDGGMAARPGAESALYWEIDDVVRARLQEALFRFDGAAISTIHGFCQRILAEQAFLGGRLFEQEHVDGQEAFGLAFREEVRRILAETGSLGEALRAWIGEERTMLELQELLYRCHREGCPDRTAVTPPWDPAGFRRAMRGLPARADLEMSIREFFKNGHQRNGYLRRLEGLFKLVDAPPAGNAEETGDPGPVSEFLDWAVKSCQVMGVSDTQLNQILLAAARPGAPEILKRLAAGLNEMARLAASKNSFFIAYLLPRVQKRLRVRKRSLGLIDYDDMLQGVGEALAGENARALLNVLRQRWRYALVDEFQDTDPVQWDIFRRIFVEGTEGHHLYIIGDPKQAIYGFRGADVHTYRAAREHLIQEKQAARLPLMENYRSTKSLIRAANLLLTAGSNDGSGFFSGLNSYREPVECGDPALFATEGVKEAVPVHLLHLYSEQGDLNSGALRRGLAHFMACEIKRLTDPKSGLLTGKKGKPASPLGLKDIYILTRSAQEGQKIGEVLRLHGIHHAFYKLEGLFTTAEAADILRLLTAIGTPQDPAARMAAWLTPFFGVPLSELEDWQDAGERHPLISRLLGWKRLADDREWPRLFESILSASGLLRRLIFLDQERELTNYVHIFELLLAEAHFRPLDLSELARKLKALIDGREAPQGREGDMQRLETDKDAVQILTMHKAKGLEAEVVFLAGGFGDPPADPLQIHIYHRHNRRCLHLGRATGEIASAIACEREEEDQRLAYVALTRARSRLYLPYFGLPMGGKEGRSYGYRSLGKFYGAIQRQLDLLRNQGGFDEQLFSVRDISCDPRPFRKGAQGAPARLSGEALLAGLPSSAELANRIRPERRGVLLTSYTRMKRRGAGAGTTPLLSEDSLEELRSSEAEGEAESGLYPPGAAAGVSPGPLIKREPSPLFGELPRGREIGIFLHALLEETAPDEITPLDPEQWSELPQVQRRAQAAARRHGFPTEYLDTALKLVYRAYRAPLAASCPETGHSFTMPGGICTGKHRQAEMAFAYPIPENFHPLLGGGPATPVQTDPRPYRAERGYIQGLVDLVFEHEGQIYLLDWKSDSLQSYAPPELQAHVKAHYSLQAQVYLLAVLRLLDIRTEKGYASLFGGILYLLIRGMEMQPGPEESPGLWFYRPSWPRVIQMEEELLKRKEWGGEVIGRSGGSGRSL